MPYDVDLAIVGAGAAGMIAALKAHERGKSVVICERDALPSGSTALSAGLIPAAHSHFQKELGIEDSPEIFAKDILKKANFEPENHFVKIIAETSGKVIDWLYEKHGFPFSVIDNFTYPGHSKHRMHGLPSRSGLELVNSLRNAVEKADIPLMLNCPVQDVIFEENQLQGIITPHEKIYAKSVILACNGYGGNAKMVHQHIPEMRGALYFGHQGNSGTALDIAAKCGLQTAFLSGYQGHGSVAKPHNILITWATMSEGGFQVNNLGLRFHDETKGYSEAAREVLKQPETIAFSIFDGRIAEIANQFEDFRQARAQNALIIAQSFDELALKLNMPAENLKQAHLERGNRLKAPFYAIKVTGALFHTQGGIKVNHKAQALLHNNQPLTNLFAAGGAALGVSGSKAEGYLSGNGLLTATTLGYLAGENA